jgi:hypothetical protein
MAEPGTDERLSFDEALVYARQSGKAAFAAAPVFGEDSESAEGARVFIVQGDDRGACTIRFVAGPFFSAAFAANELLAEEEVPECMRAMRFVQTSFSEEWLGDQIQVLIGKLTQAAQIGAPEMPDYLAPPVRKAAPEVVFPFARIGRAVPPPGREDP